MVVSLRLAAAFEVRVGTTVLILVEQGILRGSLCANYVVVVVG